MELPKASVEQEEASAAGTPDTSLFMVREKGDFSKFFLLSRTKKFRQGNDSGAHIRESFVVCLLILFFGEEGTGD